MPYILIDLPVDSQEIKEFVSVFRLKKEIELYHTHTIEKMKEMWGDDLGGDGNGYIDGKLYVVKDGQLNPQFNDINSKKLENYLAEKVGDFSLIGSLWDSSLREYEIRVPYNIGTADDEYWVDMSLDFDGSFNIKSATFSCDTDIPGNKYLTYYILKYSN